MHSAGRKVLQRVPLTHPLVRPASTSVFTSFLHNLLWKKTDHELLSLQDNLKQSGGDKQLVKEQLQSLLSDGKATTAHCKWALEHVSTGVKFDNGLILAMEEKNILIDEEAMAMVKANRLREERSNSTNMESMERLKYKLAKNGNNTARKYFKRMQQDKVVNAAHYGWAMKELCQSSDEMRALMESMKQNGVLPDVSNFNQLINKLLYDGDIVAAQHVYDVEMPAAGVVPNDRTKKTMARADKLTAQGRTMKLKNMFKQHGKAAA